MKKPACFMESLCNRATLASEKWLAGKKVLLKRLSAGKFNTVKSRSVP